MPGGHVTLQPPQPSSHHESDVIIIGGGYAGLLAANRAHHHGHTVTLVTERPVFVDRIRLHEWWPAPPAPAPPPDRCGWPAEGG